MNWLEPLLDPGPLIRSAQREPKPEARVGLALLLDGRLLSYHALAERAEWPPLDVHHTPRRGDAGSRLLAALGRHLTGADSPEEDYLELARGRNSGIATLALLLLAFFYSDTGRPQEAVAMLRRRLRRGFDPTEDALLRLQLAMRLAERAEFRAAIENLERVRRTMTGVLSARWRMALDNLAQHNLFAFEMRAQVPARNPIDLPPRSGELPLARAELLVAEGVAEYLERSFERSLADPYARTISFQREDAVEARLRGALIRSELLGDWQEAKRLRMLLGRYLVISRLGTPDSVPPAALDLLRRSGDVKGVQAAARTISSMGPLEGIRGVTRGLVEHGLVQDDEPAASLRLLAETADLLDEEEAGSGAAQVMAARATFFEQWNVAPRALAQLLRGAPAATQSEAALYVRMILHENPDAALVQELASVVSAIRWDEVEPSERTLWLSMIDRTFGSATDAHFVALHALNGLASVEREWATVFLQARFEKEPSLELLAITFDSLQPPPAWAAKRGWPLIAEGLRQIRQEASQGSYGFGRIDVGALAVASLASQRGNAEAWSDLVEFLLDPRVGTGAKTRAVDALARPDVRLPREARTRLREKISTLGGAVDHFGAPSDALAAAKLRLAAKIGGLSKQEILVGLLGLAGEPSAFGRIQAAATLVPVERRVGAAVATTTALMLARDVNHDVRAAAARALAQLGGDGDEPLEAAQRERLQALLAEPGAVVPFGALAGLYDAAQTGRPPDDELRARVGRIARTHLSRNVREGAGKLLAAIEPDAEETQR
jgi:hypothetical protein